jgi:hypothetical protein
MSWDPIFTLPKRGNPGERWGVSRESYERIHQERQRETLSKQRALVGRRIRFREDPRTTAHWRRHDPRNWHPSGGMTGTIIGWPPPDHFGAGAQVRFDNGRIKYLGSMQRYDLI